MYYAVGILQQQPPHLRERHFPEQVIKGGERVIKEYQAQFTQLLTAGTLEQERRIAEQLTLNTNGKPRVNAPVPKEK